MDIWKGLKKRGVKSGEKVTLEHLNGIFVTRIRKLALFSSDGKELSQPLESPKKANLPALCKHTVFYGGDTLYRRLGELQTRLGIEDDPVVPAAPQEVANPNLQDNQVPTAERQPAAAAGQRARGEKRGNREGAKGARQGRDKRRRVAPPASQRVPAAGEAVTVVRTHSGRTIKRNRRHDN